MSEMRELTPKGKIIVDIGSLSITSVNYHAEEDGNVSLSWIKERKSLQVSGNDKTSERLSDYLADIKGEVKDVYLVAPTKTPINEKVNVSHLFETFDYKGNTCMLSKRFVREVVEVMELFPERNFHIVSKFEVLALLPKSLGIEYKTVTVVELGWEAVTVVRVNSEDDSVIIQQYSNFSGNYLLKQSDSSTSVYKFIMDLSMKGIPTELDYDVLQNDYWDFLESLGEEDTMLLAGGLSNLSIFTTPIRKMPFRVFELEKGVDTKLEALRPVCLFGEEMLNVIQSKSKIIEGEKNNDVPTSITVSIEGDTTWGEEFNNHIMPEVKLKAKLNSLNPPRQRHTVLGLFLLVVILSISSYTMRICVRQGYLAPTIFTGNTVATTFADKELAVLEESVENIISYSAELYGLNEIYIQYRVVKLPKERAIKILIALPCQEEEYINVFIDALENVSFNRRMETRLVSSTDVSGEDSNNGVSIFEVIWGTKQVP